MGDVIEFTQKKCLIDPELYRMFSEGPWNEVGLACRIASCIVSLRKPDHKRMMRDFLDSDPAFVEWTLADREAAIGTLKRAISVLRSAQKRDQCVLDKALTGIGF
jgi:hypothetical protein